MNRLDEIDQEIKKLQEEKEFLLHSPDLVGKILNEITFWPHTGFDGKLSSLDAQDIPDWVRSIPVSGLVIDGTLFSIYYYTYTSVVISTDKKVSLADWIYFINKYVKKFDFSNIYHQIESEQIKLNNLELLKDKLCSL